MPLRSKSLLASVVLLAACSAVPAGKTLVFDCEGFEVVVRTGPGELMLYLPGREVVLPQVRAASGVKYADNGILFWMKGDGALFELDGVRHGSCQRTPEVNVTW